MTSAHEMAAPKRGEPRPWSIALKKSGSRVEIDIHDIIGSDFRFGDGVTAKDVLAQLKEAKDATEIEVRINSIGGYLYEGKAIYNLLRERAASGAKVIVKVDGLAASAASVIAMAGDPIFMPRNAFIMIHEGRGGTFGRAEDFFKRAELLTRENRQMAEIYSAASERRGKGKTVDEFLAAMAEETYFDADQAIEWGLADSVVDDVKVAAAAVDISELQRVPDALRSAPYVTRAQANDPPTDPEPEPAPAEPPAPEPAPTPPAPSPAPTESTPEPPEKTHMSNDTKNNDATPSVARALGLPAGSSESDIVAAAGRCRELELQIMAITACATSNEALGAVRGLKAKADDVDKLSAENVQLKAERDEQKFDGLIARGTAACQLLPPEVEHYRGLFTQAKQNGRGSDIVGQLEGYLKVAPRKLPQRQAPPAAESKGAADGQGLTWNGKTYAQLKFAERGRLAKEDPDLWTAMKADFDASQNAH